MSPLRAQALAGGTLGDLGPLEDAPAPAPIAIVFRVPGPPVPWERVAAGHVPPRTRAYKQLVGLCALGARSQPRRWPLDAPAYAVSIEVYRVPPTGKARRGDWDNYGKSIGDALSGVLYLDDSAVLDGRVRILPCVAGRECAIVRVEALPPGAPR